jgi:hypothetical protein
MYTITYHVYHEFRITMTEIILHFHMYIIKTYCCRRIIKIKLCRSYALLKQRQQYKIRSCLNPYG